MLQKLGAALAKLLFIALVVLGMAFAAVSWLVNPDHPLDGFHTIVSIIKTWLATHHH